MGLVLAAASCAVAAPLEPADPVTLGERVFAEECAACHGQAAAGGVGPAPALNGTAHAWHHPDQQLYDFICRGKPGLLADMPAFGGKLAPEEIRSVIAYFKSLWPQELRRIQEDTSERMAGEYPPCP